MLIKNKKSLYQIEELFLPGLIHGFSTKAFGNMSFRYDSKNEVEKNQKKFAAAVGINTENIVKLDLVHGTKAVVVSSKNKGKIIPESDALITNNKDLALWLLTGDCPPFILYDPKKKVIAVAHSGWMGTVGKIVTKTIALMATKFQCNLMDILVSIGPSIEKCCYINPRPNVQEFLPEWSKFIFNDSKKSARIDLNGFTINELVEIGIPKKNVFYSNFCTKDHSDEFFCSQEEAVGKAKPGRFATVVQMI